jgi:molybdate transport system substrate-binding protein
MIAALRSYSAAAVVAVIMLPVSSGCSQTEREATLVVFAAASLTDAFEEMKEAFESTHAGILLQISPAGSSALREQILEGAPADVYASADVGNMEAVARAGALAGEAVPFARNRMQIAVPLGNPGDVRGLADFARPELLIGVCAATVPCGRYGREVLAAAGVEPSIDTDEPNVRSLLTKVEAGELDAGLVYRSDVVTTHSIEGVEIPGWNVEAVYQIGVLEGSSDPASAQLFVEFVMSPVGRDVLVGHGFLSP